MYDSYLTFAKQKKIIKKITGNVHDGLQIIQHNPDLPVILFNN